MEDLLTQQETEFYQLIKLWLSIPLLFLLEQLLIHPTFWKKLRQSCVLFVQLSIGIFLSTLILVNTSGDTHLARSGYFVSTCLKTLRYDKITRKKTN